MEAGQQDFPMDPSHLSLFEEARSLVRAGKAEPALVAYRRALAAQPDSAGGWAEFGSLLLNLGLLDEAEQVSGKALELAPTHALAQLNTAYVHLRRGHHAEGAQVCRAALEKHPDDIDLSLALCECLVKAGELDQAQALLKGIIEREPAHTKARNLLGVVYLQQGNLEEIRRELESRLSAFTGISGEYQRATLNLKFGDMPLGWKQYEARWQIPEFSDSEQHHEGPRWDGKPYPGKSLLLFWEQGFGDTLQMIRYAPMVKALGGRLVVTVQSQLADLVATCPGIDEVVPHGCALPDFDLQAPLMSLPWLFRTELASIPAEIPYLSVPRHVQNRGALLAALAPSEGRLRVGMAWSGSTTHKNDLHRSMPAACCAPLADLPGIAWHSFQVGGPQEPPFPDITPLAPLLSNFSDTAFALSAMDLLITVDTAVAHLAGALGIPTFLLVTAMPDWRWLMGRADSPWYPTMRIYRQPAPGDWDGAIRLVLEDLLAAPELD